MWDTIRRIDSENANVYKYVFEKDDAVAESVLYKYPTFNERTVVCCSTQSGCPVGCRFCGAGDAYVRSLTAEEIVSQTAHLFKDMGIYAPHVKRMQVMFMSMGEPMLNTKALFPAIRTLHDNYPDARLLISTIGPRVLDTVWADLCTLSTEIEPVGLQFSVHESTDEKRDALIPLKGKLNLSEIAYMGERWHDACGKRPFFNYCAHAENTSSDDVQRLYGLFDPNVWNCTVSVICERDEKVAAANARQRSLAEDFMAKMVEKGYDTRCFDPAGQDDIGGGCGQLWFVQDWMRNHAHLAKPSVGHRLPVVHTPRILV